MPVSTVFPLGDEVPLPYKSMYDPFVNLGAIAAVTSKILGLPTTPEYIDILMKYEVDRMILNIPNDSAAAAPDQLDACSIRRQVMVRSAISSPRLSA